MSGIIKKFRKFFFFILYMTGIHIIIREMFQRNKITIVQFHDISQSCSKKIFKYLSKKYTVISLRDLVRTYADPNQSINQFPQKTLIITVDDGLRNNYYILEAIKKYKIPVTMFITTGIIGTQKGYWWNHNHTSETTDKLKKIPDEERLKKLAHHGFNENKEFDNRESLSIDEIKEMSAYIDFQPHSVTHPIFPMCSDEKAKYEINHSKYFLESFFGFDVYAFAYPNGKFTEREESMVKSSGYDCALTTINDYNDMNLDLFQLRRISGGTGTSFFETAIKASGFWAKIVKRMFKNIGSSRIIVGRMI